MHNLGLAMSEDASHGQLIQKIVKIAQMRNIRGRQHNVKEKILGGPLREARWLPEGDCRPPGR